MAPETEFGCGIPSGKRCGSPNVKVTKSLGSPIVPRLSLPTPQANEVRPSPRGPLSPSGVQKLSPRRQAPEEGHQSPRFGTPRTPQTVEPLSARALESARRRQEESISAHVLRRRSCSVASKNESSPPATRSIGSRPNPLLAGGSPARVRSATRRRHGSGPAACGVVEKILDAAERPSSRARLTHALGDHSQHAARVSSARGTFDVADEQAVLAEQRAALLELFSNASPGKESLPQESTQSLSATPKAPTSAPSRSSVCWSDTAYSRPQTPLSRRLDDGQANDDQENYDTARSRRSSGYSHYSQGVPRFRRTPTFHEPEPADLSRLISPVGSSTLQEPSMTAVQSDLPGRQAIDEWDVSDGDVDMSTCSRMELLCEKAAKLVLEMRGVVSPSGPLEPRGRSNQTPSEVTSSIEQSGVGSESSLERRRPNRELSPAQSPVPSELPSTSLASQDVSKSEVAPARSLEKQVEQLQIELKDARDRIAALERNAQMAAAAQHWSSSASLRPIRRKLDLPGEQYENTSYGSNTNVGSPSFPTARYSTATTSSRGSLISSSYPVMRLKQQEYSQHNQMAQMVDTPPPTVRVGSASSRRIDAHVNSSPDGMKSQQSSMLHAQRSVGSFNVPPLRVNPVAAG